MKWICSLLGLLTLAAVSAMETGELIYGTDARDSSNRPVRILETIRTDAPGKTGQREIQTSSPQLKTRIPDAFKHRPGRSDEEHQRQNRRPKREGPAPRRPDAAENQNGGGGTDETGKSAAGRDVHPEKRDNDEPQRDAAERRQRRLAQTPSGDEKKTA